MASTPVTPRLLRAMNDRAALDLLLYQGPLSRTHARRAHRPVQADRLAAAGSARARRPGPRQRQQRRPPRPERPALRDQRRAAAYVAGLDVTPARIRAAVADITGHVVGELRARPHPAGARTDTVERVMKARRRRARRGRARPRPTAPASRSARPAPSTRPPAGSATPATCPGWHDPAPARRAGRRARQSRSRSRTTSTSPPSPSSRSGAPRAATTSCCSGARKASAPRS